MKKSVIKNISKFLGLFCAILVGLLVLLIMINVIMRFVFSTGSLALQELEWHLFSAIFLLGMAYTLHDDAHVRVDLFYERMTAYEKAWVNFLGLLFFVLPFGSMMMWSSWDFVMYSYQIREGSGDPGGLPFRFLLKALIPLSAVFLLFEACLALRRSYFILRESSKRPHSS